MAWGSASAQENIASNFISGLVILAERPITIGDRVEAAGITGQVQNSRSQHGHSNERQHHDDCPKHEIHRSPVTNWTYGDPRVRFRIPVGVAYGVISPKCARLLAAGREKLTL